MTMKLKDLAIDHDYYASGSNFYSNDASLHYNTWADFYEDFNDADIDRNLVYRWDITKRDESERYYMQIVIIVQRKGIYMPIHIDDVDENDVPQIKEFMKPHFEKLLSIWNPLSKEFLNNNTWISCEDSLPENDGEYLTYNKANDSMTVQYFDGRVWGYLATIKPDITHWTKLPHA